MYFYFESLLYCAPEADASDEKFILPDGRLIEVTSRYENDGTPRAFVQVPHNYVYSDLRELANHFEADLAHRVDL